MKVALVYDHVNKIGGAERVLIALHELYPQAPLFTPVYDLQAAPWARQFELRGSFLQRLPFAKRFHEFYPGLPVLAVELFDFSGFDVVISVTSAEAKGIITGPNTLHICYCLTPTRYLWSHYYDYFRNSSIRVLSLPLISALRIWDYAAAQRPDAYLAISETVKRRITSYYGRSSSLIYPPVDTDTFIPGKYATEDYLLIVSRLVKYKHIELAIDACNRLKMPLKIVGEGWEKRNLQANAGPTIEFVGAVSEEQLLEYYQKCRAVLFTQEEDFGITALEALACGKPVIAYKAGGAAETLIEGVTGEFFTEQTSLAIQHAVGRFAKKRYNSTSCRKRALTFSKHRFLKEFADIVNSEWQTFNKI